MTDATVTTARRTGAHRGTSGPVRRFVDSPWFFWPILAVPALGFTIAWANGVQGPNGELPTEWLLHPTGEFSARFMIITMMLTPLRMLFPQSGFVRWFLRRRRWLGVAAFLYAALHTLLYVIDMGTLREVLDEALVPGILTGWLAFIVFVPLAATSNDRSVRAMGRTWKTLQRFVYPAAVATLLHWGLVHNEWGPAIVNFAPLVALEAYRVWRNASPKKAKPRTVAA